MAAFVSLLIYAAGLLWNDYFDLPEDARERPSRPLPSGRIRVGQVALAANVLVAAAVAASAIAEPKGKTMLYVVMALGMVVLAYDWSLKRRPVLGPLAMGSCRGLSVLVGAAAFGPAGLKSIRRHRGRRRHHAVRGGGNLAGTGRDPQAAGERAASRNRGRFVAWLAGAGVALFAAEQLPAEL